MVSRRLFVALAFAIAGVAACGGRASGDLDGAGSQELSTGAGQREESPPPPPCGGPQGASCDLGCAPESVCCAAPEPCAGRCVPDCRTHRDLPCPPATVCDEASGVCKRTRSR